MKHAFMKSPAWAKAKIGIAAAAGFVIVGGGAVTIAQVASDKPAPGSGQPAATESKLDPPFIISLWCGPDRKHTTVDAYKAVADCGFNLVLPPGDSWGSDAKANRQVLDICQQVGLKALIADSRMVNTGGRHAIKPGDPAFAKTLDAVAADYSAHPALAGYYVEDEPSTKDFPDLASIFRRLREKDPKHFAYVNLFPSYAGNDRLGSRNFEDHVATFVEKLQPAIVSWDHYQQMSGNRGPDYFSDLEDVRKVCVKSGTPCFQIILVTPHGGYRDPSEADLRWQVYTTLCYGAHGIMYFTYWPVIGPGIVDGNGKPGPKYPIVRGINARLKALALTLVKLKSAGVYHTEPLPKGTQKLAADAPVKKMAGGEMVLGWLKDGAGGEYIFVVNRSFKDKIKAQLTLDAAIKQVDEISQETGKPQAAAYAAGVLSADLEAGEGKLFRLEKPMGEPLGTTAPKSSFRVTLDKEKRICVDGQPFYPIGLYATPVENLADARALGFNTVHTYAGEGTKGIKEFRSYKGKELGKDFPDYNWAAPVEEMKEYLDAADKLGLKVFMGLPRRQMVETNKAALKERITLLKTSPGLLLWYLYDEPAQEGVPIATVQAVAEVIRETDSLHPTVEVMCTVAGNWDRSKTASGYFTIPDIIMTDQYPCNGRTSDLSPVSGDILATRKIVADSKPVMNVVQLHGGLSSVEELRNMTYQSVAAGAKGVTFWAGTVPHVKLFKDARKMEWVKRVTGELQTLSPALLAPEPAVSPLRVEANPAILARTFVHEGKALLVAVNLKRAPTTISVSGAGWNLPPEVNVLFENRTVKTADGKLSEPIEPIGVRIYEVTVKE